MSALIAPDQPHSPTPDGPPPARIEDSEHEIVNGRIVEPKPIDPPVPRIEDSDLEIVNGKIVEAKPMGVWECIVATKILGRLIIFLECNKAGRAVSENLFILRRDPLLRRKPDAAFVSSERWALDRPIPRGEAAWDVIPDLVVEVVSPTDLMSEVQAKLAEYRIAGVQIIWIVHPDQAEIYDYRAGQPIQIHGPGAVVDGGNLLPGFALALNDLFELD